MKRKLLLFCALLVLLLNTSVSLQVTCLHSLRMANSLGFIS